MKWSTRVELASCKQDWLQARDCFVRAFQNYSLYKYLIPNERKRPEFLKQYLEAIYEVLVKNGKSVLLCIKLIQQQDSKAYPEKDIVIGGVLLVPPSSTGGWECQRDEDFWSAYEKFRLREIDEESLKRIERYEKWEYETISKRVCKSGTPMWNGILCGMDPKYAGRGCGTLNYANCLEALSKAYPHATTKTATMNKFFRQVNYKLLPKSVRKSIDRKSLPARHNTTIFAISHSKRAVNFHTNNGFRQIAEIPYAARNKNHNPETPCPFTVSALVLSMSEKTNPDAKNFNLPLLHKHKTTV